MRELRRPTIRTVQAVIAVVIVFSLVVQLVLLFTGGADANSGEAGAVASIGTRLARLFSYFTIQSNIVVCVVAILLVLRPDRDGRWWHAARLTSLVAIVITGLVFAVVLAPLVHLTGWALVATIGFHYVSPWLTLLAWVALGPRRRFTLRTAVAAFVWPILWLVYTFVRGAVVHWYPYPFLDVDRIGFDRALTNSLGVLGLGVVVAALLCLVDRRTPALLAPAEDRSARVSGT
ncbi:Pr6Pr family membrane protein [Pseudonocardia sp. CA-107938]|uniref:Pr6Pr family membrane protein n=1 Tax=Pseudonocardia sp. CA-107938 TaxID=3240021 RepID=UPI003D92E334